MFVSSPPVRSASDALSMHHPKVKLIPKIQEKSKEEQIIRCADRLKMAKNPFVVDALYKTFMALQKDPDDVKFRRINKTSKGYQRCFTNAPGAEDLLLAMNYRKEDGTNYLVLDRFMVDPALLYLGISALEKTIQTKEYKETKKKASFAKTITTILLKQQQQQQQQETSSSMMMEKEEGRRRAEHAIYVPIEPTGGRGAFLQVHVLDDIVFRRRFDGDDTLDDVLHWLASEMSSTFYTNIIETREWCLVDRNRYPIQPLDCQGLRNQTLQYIGCWPSGKLEIMPSTDDWINHGQQMKDVQTIGSSRGLASAPSEVLVF